MPLLETLEDVLCVYKSTRFIRVKNHKLAFVYYVCIIAVILYIVLYTILYNKGYQETDPVTGTTSVKLKGTGSTNSTGGIITVYDAMDLVYPSMEENAFFVTTSMIITPNQKRDTCPGNKDVPKCNTTNYAIVCAKGTYSPKSQGIYTGNCCYSKQANNCNANYSSYDNDQCEVKSWCPPEHDNISVAQNVTNIGVFTAFVKVDIAFSNFNVERSNTLDIHKTHAPVDGYNLFTLDEIVGNATNGQIRNISNSSIISGGAIILMESNWNCNLDKGENNCNPKWKFFRIDSEPDTMSFGYNYRAVTYDVEMSRRMLRKLYGIRVVFTTSGVGGRFSFAALTITFGAGLAYLGAAAFITDIVLEKFLPQSEAYARLKTHVTDDKKIISMSVKNVNNPDHYHDLSLSTHNEDAGQMQNVK